MPRNTATPKTARSTKPAANRRRNALNIRVRDHVRDKLLATAMISQRSMSEEVEHLLEKSLDSEENIYSLFDLAFGRQLAGLLILIARVARQTGQYAAMLNKGTFRSMDEWIDDPYAYGQVEDAIIALLAELRPAGETPLPVLKMGAPGAGQMIAVKNLGHNFAANALAAVAGNPDALGDPTWASVIGPRLGLKAMERIEGFRAPKRGR